jgi:hydrogenase expression/formation protein HypD
MKFIDEFRDGDLARTLARDITREARSDREYNLMEFCGGHTHALCRYGLMDLLPSQVKMVHGPGCPVCVLPIGRLDQAIEASLKPNVILCAYGDLMRVPGSDRVSLLKAKARGAQVRLVLGSNEALRIAKENPGKEVVFFAIGFETTTPMTAVALKRAEAEGLTNFSVLCNHVLTPSAIAAILGSAEAKAGQVKVDGFVGPGHVSTIIGYAPYERFALEDKKPIAISGFEPIDLLQSILMLVRQINDGRSVVENQFTRAVNREGNLKAQALIAETLELRSSFEWRGLGTIPDSALQVRPAYAAWDAEQKFNLASHVVADHPACACGEILKGLKKPPDCRIFATGCTPENPIGACMVSPEGSCSAYYLYGRHRSSSQKAAS